MCTFCTKEILRRMALISLLNQSLNEEILEADFVTGDSQSLVFWCAIMGGGCFGFYDK